MIFEQPSVIFLTQSVDGKNSEVEVFNEAEPLTAPCDRYSSSDTLSCIKIRFGTLRTQSLRVIAQGFNRKDFDI